MVEQNRVAIVTGASRGIGKAIALGLAREGMRVVVAARTEVAKSPDLPGSIHDTTAEIERLGSKALALKCDVTNEEDVTNAVDRTLSTFGRIDVLVNNAGVAFSRPVVETPLRRWRLVVEVNLTGAFLFSKVVLPAMIRQRGGSVINISSLAANERDDGTVSTGLAYGAAKAALDRFTFGLACEVGRHNIAVNCLKPKLPVDTEGMRFWTPEERRKGWTSADKMVKCAVFLAKQDATGVTGTVATDEELSLWHGL